MSWDPAIPIRTEPGVWVTNSQFWQAVIEAQEFYDDLEHIINHVAFKLGFDV